MKKIVPFHFFWIIASLLFTSSIISAQNKNRSTDPESRMKSWQQHVKLKNESPLKHLKWRAVGPEFQGGRIEAIACFPDQPYTIYVGAGAGNLWKTDNNGITWKPIFENESTFSIDPI